MKTSKKLSKQIKRFKFHPGKHSNILSLPFITKSKVGRNWFDIPVTGDYGIDCNTGKYCANMLIKAIRDDSGNDDGGHLQLIASSLMEDPKTKDDLRGVIVSFFSELESWLQHAAKNENRLDNTGYGYFTSKVIDGLKEVK